MKLWNSPSGNGNEQTSCRMHYAKQTSASPWPDTRNNSIKNTLILLASRSTFLLHWLLCINEKLAALMVKARLGPVCGLGCTVESQETLEMKVANYIQRSMAKKTTVGWEGKRDEWLTAGKVELSDSRACLQQLEKCISLDCSSSEFPPINAALGRMKVLWLFSKI